MLGAISILLALLIGFLLVKVLDPVGNMQPRWAATLFDGALGTGWPLVVSMDNSWE